ncbi:potassium channel, sub T, member 2 [Boothiomyces sp. JEL0838]|nr:potassium channel, sub T, member 2 [Boothiomyces sp. JEL0838]
MEEGIDHPENSIIDSLDKSAPEVVMSTLAKQNFIFKLFQTKYATSYSDIRQIYNLQRKSERNDQSNAKFTARIRVYIVETLSKLKKIREISITALIVDFIFTIFYLSEIQDNAEIPCTSNNSYCGDTGLPPWMLMHRPAETFHVMVGLAVIQLAVLVLTSVFIVDSARAYLTSPLTLLDLAIIIPFIALSRYPGSRYIYIPYFLRIFLLVPNLKSVLRLRKQWSPVNFSDYKEKLIILLAYIWACSFNYFETKFPNTIGLQNQLTGKAGENGGQLLGIIETFYFVVITMSTVGYGDIVPKTIPGQIVIIILIFAGITLLPGLATDLTETIKIQSSGVGHYTRGKSPYLVICGNLTETTRIVEMIKEVFRKDPKKTMKVVLLSRSPITEELKYHLNHYSLKQRVTFLQGSGLENSDFERVQLHFAQASFILASNTAENHRIEDEHNTLRAWAFDKFAPDTPIYLETILPQTAYLQEDLASGIVCIDEFKQIFLAYNCIYRGIGTLMINLLRGTKNYNHFDIPWQAQYADGAQNEIFKIALNPLFIGRSFSTISLYLYRQFQVITFGIHYYIPQNDIHHVALNPGLKYNLKKGDCLFVIANSRSVLQEIAELTEDQFDRTRDTVSLSLRSYNQKSQLSRDTLNVKDEYNSKYVVGYPPQTHNSKVPLCWLLPEPVQELQEVVLQNADNLKHHILVCTNDYHIFRFIATLRSSQIRSEDLKPILVMCPKSPSMQEFQRFHCFPQIYFIRGESHKAQHLRRAGLFHAYRVVLTNLSNHVHPNAVQSQEGADGLADSSTIMASNLIYKMCEHEGIRTPAVVELRKRSNIKFLSPGSVHFAPKQRRRLMGKVDDNGPTEDIHYSPMFVTGSVVAPIMMESILSSTYHQPSILNVFNVLCGVRYKVDSEIDSMLEFELATLRSIKVPREFVDGTFGRLYYNLCVTLGVIPIGLLRDVDDELGNVLPFVFTNPPWSLILKSSDSIYVIACPSAFAN